MHCDQYVCYLQREVVSRAKRKISTILHLNKLKLHNQDMELDNKSTKNNGTATDLTQVSENVRFPKNNSVDIRSRKKRSKYFKRKFSDKVFRMKQKNMDVHVIDKVSRYVFIITFVIVDIVYYAVLEAKHHEAH